MKTILLYKKVSITPLQAIWEFQLKFPEYQNVKIGYAGRLDPMAEGLLLILIGDENRQKKKYEDMSKSYDFEILLGIETDTYDLMGLVKNINSTISLNSEVEKHIREKLNMLIGTLDQKYPPYSSVRVNGKPLFYWAREGKIKEVKIPSKKIIISSITLNNLEVINLKDIIIETCKKINNVNGKFRQDRIIANWTEINKKNPSLKLIKLGCSVSCSKGTYVRAIAHEIGQTLKVGAIALSIKRIKIGPFSIEDAINI